MTDGEKFLLNYVIALQDVMELLVVEMAGAGRLDVDGLCERIEFVSAARRQQSDGAEVATHMHRISETLRSAAERNPSPPKLQEK